ncbi:hypothetical protein EXIGLDRAFT_836272 [Exidia glandulosa HHB12029]|uniref:F-box domain-containing protein n=1 Tax=Exidia glandulosa HHB12029 TaxID=1314781 RepID=A0A165HZ33_EXIGL|nr:hypothetical protein EXIGLDRAFT_836272 [Exidia glandulosa HHB12029]
MASTTTTTSTAKSSAEKLPAEVWLAITALLPQPTQDSPWPATLTALGGTDRFLHRVVRRSLYRKLFFFNPPASSALDLPAFVLRCSQELQQDRDLCRSVREVVVHSREGEFGFKHSYPEFLTVMDPFHSILESIKSSKLRALALHKFVLTRLSHIALYGLRNLHSLELDFTYLSPLPETIPPPPTHLKRLHELVIRKQTSVKDQEEANTFVALILASPNLRTLHADEPLLSFIARRRKRLPLEHLIVSIPKDLHALLRCCPGLKSIEFAFMPLHPPSAELVPKLERYRGPTHGVCAYVPGRPVRVVDITGTLDADQLDGVVPCLTRATAPTEALKLVLATRGCVPYRVGKLATLATLPALTQLVVDSDFACQSDEVFAREFTRGLAGKLNELKSLDVVGADRPSSSLNQHIGDHRLQRHLRDIMFAAPPEPESWELELAQEWARRSPELRSVSWGVWRWIRPDTANGEWKRVPRELEVRLVP